MTAGENRTSPFVNWRDELAGQRQNVLAALAQRRHEDFHHVQPVEQVLAKSARFDFLFEVAVGGGEDAGVGVKFLGWSRRVGSGRPG